MQSGNGTEVHEGNDTYGKAADGQRTSNQRMGKTQIDHAKLDDQTGNETEGKSMTGWEVQAMWEADTAALWERLNAPDPYEKEMHDAALNMRLAIEMINKAEDYLADAVTDLSGTPMEDRIQSFLNDMEDLHSDINYQRYKYERGERE